jgi:hypothetical protein
VVNPRSERQEAETENENSHHGRKRYGCFISKKWCVLPIDIREFLLCLAIASVEIYEVINSRTDSKKEGQSNIAKLLISSILGAYL